MNALPIPAEEDAVKELKLWLFLPRPLVRLLLLFTLFDIFIPMMWVFFFYLLFFFFNPQMFLVFLIVALRQKRLSRRISPTLLWP